MFSRGSNGFCLSILFLYLIVGVEWSTSVVVLENNGYKGVVVAIQKNISENPQLVHYIKNMVTKASAHLYKITKNRVYFEEVTIVVPESWSPSSDYESVQGGDRFSRAEVRVDRANPMYGDTPYTLQAGQCGERGEYIHFTPEFIVGISNTTSPNDFKDIYGDDSGRIFAHEWAHLRYGIFDEYVDQTVPHLSKFYFDGMNRIQATGCSEGVRGHLGDRDGNPCVRGVDGLPTSDCIFYPETQIGSHDPHKPSIMYLPGLESADGFCEDDNSNGRKHNTFAPNKHNIECSGRSTWEVVSSNPDFKNSSSPRQITNLTPKFRVIQPRLNQKPTYVLVLDTSGSMQGRRIELQHAAASRFIKLQLADSVMVGMVTFSSDARVVSSMTTVNNQTRAALLTRVPSANAGGSTAIGKGIQTGIKLLKDNGIPTEGALVLLVSDGEENVVPYIDSILPEISASKIIINTIAFGKQATTKFEKLVTLTGGRAFFFDDDKASHKLLDTAFVESATTHLDVELRSNELMHRDNKIKANDEFKGSFRIDQDVGKNTVFQISYDKVTSTSLEPVTITLSNPANTKYDSTSAGYYSDTNIKTMGIKIPQAVPGKWEYTIKNLQSANTDLTLMINSETLNANTEPVRVRAWLSELNVASPSMVKVFAEVKKGYNAIIGAKVKATIGRPQGEAITLILLDNGSGADTNSGDGIYSGYFAKFNGVGRYSVEAVVENDGQAKIKTASGAQGSTAPRMGPLSLIKEKRGPEPPKSYFDPLELELGTGSPEADGQSDFDYKPIDEFERYASGGAFRLNTYSPNVDVIPPSKVTDLKIINVNFTSRTVNLNWTSPDDDVSEQDVITEVRYHQELNVLLKNFNQAVRVDENQQFNETEIELPYDMQLNESNYRVYFAARSRDKAGNIGDISNWVMVQFPNPIFAEVIQINMWSYFLNSQYFILTIAATAAVLTLIIICIICKVCCKKNRKENLIPMNDIHIPK